MHAVRMSLDESTVSCVYHVCIGTTSLIVQQLFTKARYYLHYTTITGLAPAVSENKARRAIGYGRARRLLRLCIHSNSNRAEYNNLLFPQFGQI